MDENSIITGARLPSLEYLLTCSEESLADIELAALNRYANCLKTARAELTEAIAQREAAGVARWLRDNRAELLERARRTLQVGKETISGPKKGLDALFGEEEKK